MAGDFIEGFAGGVVDRASQRDKVERRLDSGRCSLWPPLAIRPMHGRRRRPRRAAGVDVGLY